MKNNATLIETNNYYGIFSALIKALDGKTTGLKGKNLIFCEEKISLMAESAICSAYSGSFNTDVYSFGNYLRKNKKIENVLGKEGAVMAVRKVLNAVPLNCFNKSRVNLSRALYELIIQLKSAKVSPEDVFAAIGGTDGLLKNKITDVYSVYSEYEKFLKNNGLEDQSSVLSYLPDVIENDKDVENTDVVLLGFTSWTAQARAAVETIIKKAKSVTAITVGGENGFLYVNEVTEAFARLCRKQGVSVSYEKITDYANEESEIINRNLFNPAAYKREPKETDKIFVTAYSDEYEEIKTVAETIKKAVTEKKCRYSDVNVVIDKSYADALKEYFSLLEIPFFLDEKKKADNHPLVKLIVSYADIFKSGFEREKVLSFIKNPLFSEDKNANDLFDNFVTENNINYEKIKLPFEGDKELISLIEPIRKNFCEVTEKFDVNELLEKLNAEEKIKNFSVFLAESGQAEEKGLNDQAYDAVISLLNQMEMILGKNALAPSEFKTVFLTGVSAMELSLIPQYRDAVFVGDFKETALVSSDYLFVTGLNETRPVAGDDVAILSDSDIDRLEKLKLLVEPKIKAVNDRAREQAGLAVTAFKKGLFLSYGLNGSNGDKHEESEIITYVKKLFNCKKLNFSSDYLTEKQGIRNFAKACGDFAAGKINDFTAPSSFYAAADKTRLNEILNASNKEIKLRLENRSAVGEITSPTAIEDYYSCPLKAFLTRTLKIKEKEVGEVSPLSVGNFMHDVFERYVKNIDKVNDEETSAALVREIAEKLFLSEKYSRYLKDESAKAVIDRLIEEATDYCYKTYEQLTRSKFKPAETEVKFGDGEKYPAVSLLGGKIKLRGKIDRIDEYDKYYRVIDYKTGAATASEKYLFTGLKLQLYLYASVIKDKQLAGVYYLPVSGGYKKGGDKEPPMTVGKSLNDKEVLFAQDENLKENGVSEFLETRIEQLKKGEKISKATDGEILRAFTEYALKMCENAAMQMEEGVIAPSPFEDACKYCGYKGICDFSAVTPRETGKIDEETVALAVKEGEENAES